LGRGVSRDGKERETPDEKPKAGEGGRKNAMQQKAQVQSGARYYPGRRARRNRIEGTVRFDGGDCDRDGSIQADPVSIEGAPAFLAKACWSVDSVASVEV